MSSPTPVAPSLDNVDTATEIIRALTGNRWQWPPLRIVEVYSISPRASAILLQGRPALTIEDVIDYRTKAPVAAELSDNFRLHLTHLGCCSPIIGDYYPAWWTGNPFVDRVGVCAREIQVTYTAGSKPSKQITRAILQLATEFTRYDLEGSCALPERVTSVNRQGVSWTMIDPMEFIEKGRTGLYFVDLVLGAANAGGKVRARARVLSPDQPIPRRLSATRLDPDSITS